MLRASPVTDSRGGYEIMSGAPIPVARAHLASAVVAIFVFISIGPRPASGAGGTLNACGCYQDSTGSCLCGRTTKCGCPGECEPRGCEEKRAKLLQKEIDAETRKAREADHRQKSADSGHEAQPEDKDPEVARHHTSNVVHMTSAQKRTLARLLKLYLAEYPDGGRSTLNDVRHRITPGTGR
jgi:hypothetical protein